MLPLPEDTMTVASLDTIANLAKRRGFVYPASELYGGLRSAWDYGPLGVELLRNLKDSWWEVMVRNRDDIVGLDSSILQSSEVWIASGHVNSFTDPLVECTSCNNRFRLDKLDDPDQCPNCGKRESFTSPRQFNLMFKTFMGPVEDSSAVVYLRPETAQGIFINFANVVRTARMRSPRSASRSATRSPPASLCSGPASSSRWRWSSLCLLMRPSSGTSTGSRSGASGISIWACAPTMSAFALTTMTSWPTTRELEGIANRTDFDLRAHAERSGEDLRYFNQEADERYYPYVIEPAAGVTRSAFAFLLDAYHEEEVRGDKRVVLRLHPRLAPIKVAVLPLSKKPDLVGVTHEVAEALRPHWNIEVDVTQSIGRRYRRQDEIGTPYAVTVDFDTLEDRAVTVRDRDTMEQDRVPITGLVGYLSGRFEGLL
jgi:glycyl-tRNA synthetase